MNATIQQIVSSHESLSMTPEQIQQELFPEMELAVIKHTLLQYSSLYKATNKHLEAAGMDGDITDDEFVAIKRTLKDIALHNESDELRARYCKYLWDEKKGRNDASLIAAKAKTKQLANAPTVNIIMLSKHLEQSK